MRALIVSIFFLIISGCAAQRDSSTDVENFYREYMFLYSSENVTDLANFTHPIIKKYVANDVITRLSIITSLYEQEILLADYFLNIQDYDPSWIGQLKVERAENFLGGEKMNVWIGGPKGSKPEHLIIYTRKENGSWKIYRVRDAENHYEQPIYDSGKLTGAKTWSDKITHESQQLNDQH